MFSASKELSAMGVWILMGKSVLAIFRDFLILFSKFGYSLPVDILREDFKVDILDY
jgi:hypothetical protein